MSQSSSVSVPSAYRLDDQIGFILRRAYQRHTLIFQEFMPEGLTTTQFATLVRLATHGPCSQNHLGRLTAMDVATVKGVVDRLHDRGLLTIELDERDRRRRSLSLTEAGHALCAKACREGFRISAQTLAPLSADEQAQLLGLLSKIV